MLNSMQSGTATLAAGSALQTVAMTAVDRGNYVFSGPADTLFRVRARAATIGTPDAAPGGLNTMVPGTCAYPFPEATRGNGAALYGGKSAIAADIALGGNAAPGDSYVSMTVPRGNVSNVGFGYVCNRAVNAFDDSDAADARSKRGLLRQLVKNANIIGAATVPDHGAAVEAWIEHGRTVLRSWRRTPFPQI